MTPPSPAIDYTAARFWMDFLQLAAITGIGVYTWWSNRKKANDKRFKALETGLNSKVGKDEAGEYLGRCTAHREQTEDLEDQVKQVESSIKLLEQEIKHLPSSAEIRQLNGNMVSVAEKIGSLEGRLDSADRTLGLMNEFLINQGGK